MQLIKASVISSLCESHAHLMFMAPRGDGHQTHEGDLTARIAGLAPYALRVRVSFKFA